MKRIIAFSLLGAATLAVILYVVFHNPDSAVDPAPNMSAIASTPDVNPDTAKTDAPTGPDLASDTGLEVVDTDPERTELLSAAPTAVNTESAHGMIRLRVVDAESNPAAGANAKLNYSKASRRTPVFTMIGFNPGANTKDAADLEATSNAAGEILLIDVKAGQELSLELIGPHWSKRTVPIAALDPGETRELGDLSLAPGVLLTGLVKGPNGRAIEGVNVRIMEADNSGMGMRFSGMGGQATREGKTNAEGRFRFEGMAMGSYSLNLTAAGFVKSSTSVELEASRPDHPLELHLVSGATVSGVVRNDEGTPLPDAHVALISSRGFAMAQWDHSRVIEEGLAVNEDGSFTLSGLPDKGGYRVVAAAPGFARGRSEKVLAGDKLEIALSNRMELRGTLHDSLGEAVADAEITLRKNTNERNGGFRTERASTDAEGKFHFDDLSSGQYKLEAVAAAGTLSQEGLEIGAQNDDLALTLPAGEALIVRVMDEEGQSLNQAHVVLESKGSQGPSQVIGGRQMRIVVGTDGEISSTGGSTSRRGKTDEAGMVRFVGLKAAEWTARVKKDGFADIVQTVERKDGEDQLEIIVMPKASTLRLMAVDSNGDPVAHASVELQRTDDDNYNSKSLSTDAWGLAVWTNLAPGMYAIVETSGQSTNGLIMGLGALGAPADASAQAENKIEFEIKAGEISEQQIILAAKAVTTVLVTRLGLPVANASVKLVDKGSFDFGWGFGGGGNKAITDASGLAKLPPADAGSYVIEARAANTNPPTKLEVDLLAGPQQLNLELASGVISGTVVGLSGALAGAKVRLETMTSDEHGGSSVGVSMNFVSINMSSGDDDDEEMETFEFTPGQATATTDSDGQFRFQDVPAGRYRLNLTAKGYIKFSTDSFDHDGAGQIDRGVLQMLLGASLKGRVLGLPSSSSNDQGFVSTKIVRLQDEDGNMKQIALVRKDGTYQFKDLDPGNYRLMIEVDGEKIESELISVQVGNPTEFNFNL